MKNNRNLLLAAALAGALVPFDTAHPIPHNRPRQERLPREPGEPYSRKAPVTEADHEALARAEAKRQRRAAKAHAQEGK